MNAKWSVLALFEGSAARVTAVDFCDALVQRFWPQTSFELSWFDWDELLDVSASDSATRTAKEADLLLVTAGQKGNLQPHVKRWLETSLQRRGEREGILAGLCAAGNWRDAGKRRHTAVSAQTGAPKWLGFSYQRPRKPIPIGPGKYRSVYAARHAGHDRAGFHSAPDPPTAQAALDQGRCYLPSASTAASSCCSLITGAMACSLSPGWRSISFTPWVLRPASRICLTKMRTI